MRNISPLDSLLEQIDITLRTLTNTSDGQRRSRPDKNLATPELSESEKTHHGRLMRINHTGEICAQALYQGQALTTRSAETREHLLEAAEEERDHLDWCQSRASELGIGTSLLNPVFYAQSFVIGALAGLAGDKWSFGFVTETERQVQTHLESHLKEIGNTDPQTAAIIQTMREDEIRHGQEALDAGGKKLPAPIKWTMTMASKVMTSTTYHI